MIDVIRWWKRMRKTEKSYRLVVCRECFDKYSKARQRYKRRQLECMILGIVFAAMLIISRPLQGALFGTAIVVFMYLVSQLNWVPALTMPASTKK
jgi:hypothetical protein